MDKNNVLSNAPNNAPKNATKAQSHQPTQQKQFKIKNGLTIQLTKKTTTIIKQIV